MLVTPTVMQTLYTRCVKTDIRNGSFTIEYEVDRSKLLELGKQVELMTASYATSNRVPITTKTAIIPNMSQGKATLEVQFVAAAGQQLASGVLGGRIQTLSSKQLADFSEGLQRAGCIPLSLQSDLKKAIYTNKPWQRGKP